jgi:hypothetical protein
MTGGVQGERNQIVVHFKDGRVQKGFTHDFSPVKPTFHLTSEQETDKGKIYDVNCMDLKAIFFVKSLDGNKDYTEKKKFEEVDMSQLRGMKIKVEFKDGEIIRGISLGYSKNRKGFFIIPIDPQSNNERIYIVADALRDVKLGSAAG